MNAGTPKKTVTPAILALCEQMGLEGELEFLDVTPPDDARVLDCFAVVTQQVERAGGEACYGWRIWELPWVYIEAEFHAVWRNPQAKLVDITPTHGFSRILFIPDPDRVYEGRQVNNIRRALCANPAVDGFFRAADAKFEFLNRGSRADQHELSLSLDEVAELQTITRRLEDSIVALARSIPDPGRNDPCPCASGKKYKKCCGAQIR